MPGIFLGLCQLYMLKKDFSCVYHDFMDSVVSVVSLFWGTTASFCHMLRFQASYHICLAFPWGLVIQTEVLTFASRDFTHQVISAVSAL